MSTLYLVSTPIGNKLDISLRAQDVLSSVDIILCEDTKKSGILLKDLGIENKLLSYHDHTNVSKVNYFLELLKEGASLAIISDAGTPLISDPGYELVAKAVDEKIKVTSVPGPSAVISALISSGLSTSSFVFEGYVPRKKGQLEKFLKNIQHEKKTTILFESPKRIERLVQMIVKTLGPKRKVSLAKELTKKFERIITDEAKEIQELIKNDETLKKGEMVIVIEGSEENQYITVENEKILFEEIQKLNGTKAASKIVSKISSKTSKEIYSIFAEPKNDK
ncbi:MAG: 16S rRNA (cytidine(1402)-2'-O)-methyltransferase [Gammaproteobacteria bacterium]